MPCRGVREVGGVGGSARKTVSHRLLRGEDAADDEEHRDEVDGPEVLAEEDDAEQDTDNGVHEADDRGRRRPEHGQATEPQDVGDAAAEQAEVDEGADGREIESWWRALDDEPDGQQDETAGDELPGRHGDDAVGRRPLPRQDEADRREHDGKETGCEPDRVERLVESVLEHEEGHPDEADESGANEIRAGRWRRSSRATPMVTIGAVATRVAPRPLGRR